MSDRHTLTVYLDPADYRYLKDLAAGQGHSMSAVLRDMLRQRRLREEGLMADRAVRERPGSYAAVPGQLTSSAVSGQRLLERLVRSLEQPAGKRPREDLNGRAKRFGAHLRDRFGPGVNGLHQVLLDEREEDPR